MCIIAAKPEGLVLAERTINNMWNNNNDGAGFMYAEDNKLYVEKGFMTLNDFLTAYEPHKERSMVLHFRIRTHGTTDAAMTHPFVVDENLAFAHNGIISGLGDAQHSDTWYFNEQVIKKLRERYQNFLGDEVIGELISSRIGASKLVFMDNMGTITIMNEKMGERSKDGIWFSNGSWNRDPITPTYKSNIVQYNSFRNRGTPYGYDEDDDLILWPDRTKSVVASDNLQVGDYVTTESDIFNIPVYKLLKSNSHEVLKPGYVLDKLPIGSVLKINGFNLDNSIDAYDLNLKRVLRLRSGFMIEKVKWFATTRHQWGHIPTSSRVLVASFDAHSAEVIDTKLDRCYKIPARCLKISAL